jgi:hypothetical protein
MALILADAAGVTACGRSRARISDMIGPPEPIRS